MLQIIIMIFPRTRKFSLGWVPFNFIADVIKIRLGESPDELAIQMNDSHHKNTIFDCQGCT